MNSYPTGSSVPPRDDTLGYSSEPEVDGVTLPLPPYHSHASALASHHESIHPQFVASQSDFAPHGSSSFPSAVHAPPRSTIFSSWNGYMSHHIGPSVPPPICGPPESAVNAGPNVSGHNAVATTGLFTLPHGRVHQGWGIFPSMTVSTSPSGPGISTVSYAELVAFWYSVARDAVVVRGPRVFVPQIIYQPHAQGDRERYVSLATLCSPIIFVTEGSPEWGILVQHLLSNQAVQLVEGNEPAFTSCGPSIGIRLQWPGYHPFHKQVSTKDFTHERNIISKARLAKVVAKCIMQYMETMSTQAMQVGSDGRWRVGPFNIRVDDVILVSLHHVSQGSWQPHLRLRREIGTVAAAASQNFFPPNTGMHG